MLLRLFGVGALALALLIPNPASAKGYNVVRGKCLCVVGLAVHIKPKWTASCNHDCNHPEVRPDLRKGFDAERPKRDGHEFGRMWSDSASLAPTDVSAARRVRIARQAPAAVAVGAMDRDGRTAAATAPQAHQRASVAHRTGGLVGKIVEAAIAGARSGIAPQVVAHPAGCPRVAFCGCGVAVHVLGAPVRALWLAANWLRFPRAAPAAGMVAVHPGHHHVLAIERVLPSGLVLAYDPNSGHHLTRLHVRSIAGWPVVNPHG